MQPSSNPAPVRRHSPRLLALRALQGIELLFDRAFGSRNNPWHNLGALSYFFFWIIAATGVYLFVVFDTSVLGVYRSVEAISAQWYFGGVIRSLHRYASDAFAVTISLHLIREFLNGRFTHARWFSWVSGVPLLWFAFASGINGYWLVWDQLAQFVAIATAELLDWLPVFGGSMVRNFLTPESVSDRFFSLLVFLHIGLPLILLAGMWIHIQRISRAQTKPPRALGGAAFGMLLVLSLWKPALSLAPADMAIVPAVLPLDWFYLGIYPLFYSWSAGPLWALLGGVTLLLLLVPLAALPFAGKRPPVAVVDLPNCNGCGRCVADCPYSAVIMQPRTDGSNRLREAVVNPDLCTSCGICAGACPSSMPFRSIRDLVSGIDLPQLPVQVLRTELDAALQRLTGKIKLVVFGCSCAADVNVLAAPDVAVFSLICSGQLAPSFVEYALRNGADGVLVTGCQPGDCNFRLGTVWTEQRLLGQREPHLRRRNIAEERLRMAWAGSNQQALLRREIAAFRADLERLAAEAEAEAAGAGAGSTA